jgi:YesN/AraC family two-component response regulator
MLLKTIRLLPTKYSVNRLEFGILDFVTKPFTEARLSKVFSRLLDNQQRSHYGCRYLSVKSTLAFNLWKLKTSPISKQKSTTLWFAVQAKHL